LTKLESYCEPNAVILYHNVRCKAYMLYLVSNAITYNVGYAFGLMGRNVLVVGYRSFSIGLYIC